MLRKPVPECAGVGGRRGRLITRSQSRPPCETACRAWTASASGVSQCLEAVNSDSPTGAQSVMWVTRKACLGVRSVSRERAYIRPPFCHHPTSYLIPHLRVCCAALTPHKTTSRRLVFSRSTSYRTRSKPVVRLVESPAASSSILSLTMKPTLAVFTLVVLA